MALVARIRSYGYTVVEHRVDACSFLPVQRARWFLLALRADFIGPDIAHWMERRPTPARAFGSQLCLWPNLSSAQTKAAEWTPLDHQVYSDSDPSRTPPHVKRIVRPGETLPPILTTYGRAPSIPAGALRSGDIYGFGIRARVDDRECVRHLLPGELAAAHGMRDWNHPFWWLTDIPLQQTLWHALGDAIAPVQTAWCVFTLLQAAGHLSPLPSPSTLVGRHLASMRPDLLIGPPVDAPPVPTSWQPPPQAGPARGPTRPETPVPAETKNSPEGTTATEEELITRPRSLEELLDITANTRREVLHALGLLRARRLDHNGAQGNTYGARSPRTRAPYLGVQLQGGLCPPEKC